MTQVSRKTRCPGLGSVGAGRAPECMAGRGGCGCGDQAAWLWEGPAAAEGPPLLGTEKAMGTEGKEGQDLWLGGGWWVRGALAGDRTPAGWTAPDARGGSCGESYVSS